MYKDEKQRNMRVSLSAIYLLCAKTAVNTNMCSEALCVYYSYTL